MEAQSDIWQDLMHSRMRPLLLYILAYNTHNVRDTFIYYKRQIVGENLNILQLDNTKKSFLKKKKKNLQEIKL